MSADQLQAIFKTLTGMIVSCLSFASEGQIGVVLKAIREERTDEFEKWIDLEYCKNCPSKDKY